MVCYCDIMTDRQECIDFGCCKMEFYNALNQQETSSYNGRDRAEFNREDAKKGRRK